MLTYSQSIWASTIVKQNWAKHLQIAWMPASNTYQNQSCPVSVVYTQVIKEYFQSLITKDISILNTAASVKFDITQYFPTITTAGIIKHVQ